MNFSIQEINNWYKTESGKINESLVKSSINNIVCNKLDKNIIYIGPSTIVKSIINDNSSYKNFYISTQNQYLNSMLMVLF